VISPLRRMEPCISSELPFRSPACAPPSLRISGSVQLELTEHSTLSPDFSRSPLSTTPWSDIFGGVRRSAFGVRRSAFEARARHDCPFLLDCEAVVEFDLSRTLYEASPRSGNRSGSPKNLEFFHRVSLLVLVRREHGTVQVTTNTMQRTSRAPRFMRARADPMLGPP
jgi:hypothetical protein